MTTLQKKQRLGIALNLRDVQTIQELALTVQESYPYNTEENRVAEQINELANTLESLIQSASTAATRK